MLNKRGQFFLLAAFVIIAIIAGLSATYNSSKISQEDIQLKSFHKEIKFEISKTLDYGTKIGISEQNQLVNIQNLTDYYALNNSNTNLIVVIAFPGTINIFQYSSSDDKANVSLDGNFIPFSIIQGNKYFASTSRTGKNLTFYFPGLFNREISLINGQTSEIILVKYKDGERLIIS